MIEGLNVISQQLVRDASLLQVIVVGILLIAVFGTEIVFCFRGLKHNLSRFDRIIGIIAIIACLVVLGLLFKDEVDRYNHVYNKYVVTIDDSVSYNEFINKYEIIDVQGVFYTIKEIEYAQR